EGPLERAQEELVVLDDQDSVVRRPLLLSTSGGAAPPPPTPPTGHPRRPRQEADCAGQAGARTAVKSDTLLRHFRDGRQRRPWDDQADRGPPPGRAVDLDLAAVEV